MSLKLDAPVESELVMNDLGPLAWVLDELHKSLDSANKALRRFVRDADMARGSELTELDASHLRVARQQLHQAVGALEMVGMPAPAAVLRAMESVVQNFVQHPERCSEEAATTVERAGFALIEFLEGVLKGKNASPVALFPQYRSVMELTGAERIHPADLWPMRWRWLAVALKPGIKGLPYAPEVRARMDRSVLQIVKTADRKSALLVARLCLGLAAGQESLENGGFWAIAAAYFEAMALGLLPADVYTKRTASRILQQYAALAKGDARPSDRLANDLLFYCWQALPQEGQATTVLGAVRAAYGFGSGKVVDYQTVQFGRFDPALLGMARKRIAAAAESWSALAGGDINRLKVVGEQFTAVAEVIVKLHPEGRALAQALQSAIDAVLRSGAAPSVAMAMEVATAILYLEAAYEDLDPTDNHIAERGGRLAIRLHSVGAGGEPEPLEGWMEELYRRVSDRQTMGSVVDELRASLGEVEKSLDTFFRSPDDTAPLREVPSRLAQMRGVFSVLGMDQPALATLRMRSSVEQMLVDKIDLAVARTGIFEKLGNSLGALGLLIDMLSYQRSMAKKLFVYDEELGELKPLMGRERSVLQPGLNEGANAPLAAASAAATATAIASVSEPVPATAVAAASAVQAVSPESPAPQAAAPVVPEGEDGDESEADLRDIFLEEAREVVVNGLAAARELAADPSNLAEQTTLRRAFHTLKGSARMVGLNEFGEAAWSFEQMLNAWLAEQKPASDELITLASQGMQAFGRWIEDISTSGDAVWSAAPFRQSADALRQEGRMLPLALPAGGTVQKAASAPAPLAPTAPPAAAVSEMPAPAPWAPAEPVLDTLSGPVADFTGTHFASFTDSAPLAPAEFAGTHFGTEPGVEQDAPRPDFESTHMDQVLAAEAPLPVEAALPAEDEQTAQVQQLADHLDLNVPVVPVNEAAADGAEPLLAPHLEAPALLPDTGEEALDLAELLDFGDDSGQQDFISTQVFETTGASVPRARPEFEATRSFASDGATANAELSEADVLNDFGDFELDFGDMAAAEAREVQAPQAPLDEVPEIAVAQELAAVEADADAEADLPAPVVDAVAVAETETEAEAEAEQPVPVVETETEVEPEPEPEPPVVAPTLSDQVPSEAEAVDSSEESVKVIGDLRLNIPFYNVYLNEADEWSRRLQTELSEWALELDRPIPASTVALAHSLLGSSAVVGFKALAQEARLLEHALEHVQLHNRGSAYYAEVFNNSAEDIRRLLHQFAAGFLKESDATVLHELQEIIDTDFPPVQDDFRVSTLDDDDLSTGFAEQDDEPVPIPLSAYAPLSVVAAPLRYAQAHADEVDAIDNLDADLFPIFQEEAEELLPVLGAALRQWVQTPERTSARAEVLRALHTLKGSARLAGAMRLGEMSHRMESSIEELGLEDLQSVQLEPLLSRFDELQSTFEALGQAPDDVDELEPQVALAAPAATPEDAADSEAAAAAAASASVSAAPTEQDRQAQQLRAQQVKLAMPTALAQPVRQTSGQSVRVRSQLLDRLVNQAGEVMISRARLDGRISQMLGSLGELNGNLERLRGQLRDIELQAETQMQSRLAQTKDTTQTFDPLEFDRFTRVQELTRMMAESVNDVATVQRNLLRIVDGAEDDLVAQGRQARELQRDLLRTRMVEFESISDRLYGVVRQAGKGAGKQVRLDIVGGSIEMDRGVLDRMTPAFEHILRNAVAHGIEDVATRVAAGKPAVGVITIQVSQESNDISVSMSDDGGGLHLDKIRAKAIASQLIRPEDELSQEAAANLLFMPGFSTADQVTELSGRGIGMDVVVSELHALGGRVDTTTQAGQGTTFRLILPLTTAVTQVVMLRVGGFTFGVPSNLMETVLRAPLASVQAAYEAQRYVNGDQDMPFFWAGALLQMSGRSHEPEARNLPLAVFRSAGQHLAMHVDEVLGNREVVVKNLGPQLARLPGLAGMSVLASGAVVLIYNPVALASVYGETARKLQSTAFQPAVAGETAPAQMHSAMAVQSGAESLPLVLVVDDSITVRRVTQRLLKREGFRVTLANDGLHALEKLREEKPAVVLSDIEMPRMDGFDLVRNIRADAHLKDLPVIMITSRIAQKHRDHAVELGVDHYLGKPYSEDELLVLIRDYCAVKATA